MKNLEFKLLEKKDYPLIVPMVAELNPSVSHELLNERFQEMAGQGYECLVAVQEDEIVGVCGMWITTRLYCGKQIEVDNVVVSPSVRSQGLGKKLMQWVYDYANSIDCETVELNTYITNSKSHKFYYNEGFETLGLHMQKKL